MNGFVIVFFDKQGHNPCGSDGTYFATDLKTIRGIRNRMNRKEFCKVNHERLPFMMILPYHVWWNSQITCDEMFAKGLYDIYDTFIFQHSKTIRPHYMVNESTRLCMHNYIKNLNQ